MLPNYDELPASSEQRCRSVDVPAAILFELGAPPVMIVEGNATVKFTPVPETTSDIHGNFEVREDDV